jgi:phosphopantothenoylcysteine decarboxylase/phosphopantothenate--cysteine ligase
VIQTPTAREMLDAVLAQSEVDLVLMAAAVADYRPREPLTQKRAKSDDAWQLTLEPTTDILRELAARRANGQVLVGFAADHGDRGLARAREKLLSKGVDLVVFNDVSRADIGFDAADNEVVLVGAGGDERIGKAPKDRIAAAVVEKAEELLRERA